MNFWRRRAKKMKDQFLQMRPDVEMEFDNGFRLTVLHGYVTISHKDNPGLYVRVDTDGTIEAKWARSQCTGLSTLRELEPKNIAEIMPVGTLLTQDLNKKNFTGIQIPPQKE
jgi:hypothetical protein